MMDLDEDVDESQEIKKYLADFRLNTVQVRNLGESENFKSSLQFIFEMVKYSKSKNGLKRYIEEHRQELKLLDNVEATAAFALLGQGKQVEKLLLDEKDADKEEFNMCVALDEMLKDEWMSGEAHGIELGITKLSMLICKLMEAGRFEDVARSAVDMEYQKKLFREFDIELN